MHVRCVYVAIMCILRTHSNIQKLVEQSNNGALHTPLLQETSSQSQS